ncbi:MAG: hypothetical protein J7M11_00510, partial [Elusimicrobia bacterium]|nr:hypothetical protein [Elusimicrobiota bacterium]
MKKLFNILAMILYGALLLGSLMYQYYVFKMSGLSYFSVLTALKVTPLRGKLVGLLSALVIIFAVILIIIATVDLLYEMYLPSRLKELKGDEIQESPEGENTVTDNKSGIAEIKKSFNSKIIKGGAILSVAVIALFFIFAKVTKKPGDEALKKPGMKILTLQRLEPAQKDELDVASISSPVSAQEMPEFLLVKLNMAIEDSRLFEKDFVTVTPPVDYRIERKADNEFKILLTNGLKAHTKYELKVLNILYSAHSPHFNVIELKQNATKKPVFMIKFSYPVDPEILKNYLTLHYDGENVHPYKIITKEPSKEIEVRVRKAKHGKTINFIVAPQLKDIYGNSFQKEYRQFLTVNLKKLRIFCVSHRGQTLTDGFEFHITMKEEDEKNIGKYKSIKQGRYYSYDKLPDIDPDTYKDYVRIEPSENFYILKARDKYVIKGDFKAKTEYNVTIKKGLSSKEGKQLEKDYTFKYNLGDMRPCIQILSKGHVMPSTYDHKLVIKHINVKKIRLTIRQIYQQNIVFWLTSQRDYPRNNVSDQQRHQVINLPHEQNKEIISYLDLTDMLPEDTRGVFHITIRDERGRARDTLQLIISDIGISAKKEAGGIKVWARSLKNLDPLSDVRFETFSYSNKSLEKVKTGADGSAVFSKIPYVIIARNGNDINYLPLDEPVLTLSKRETSGVSYKLKFDYKAYVYTDRGVYRPNDKAHISVLVRNQEKHAPKEEFPVNVEILDPANKVFFERAYKINRAGLFEFSYKFGNFPKTGNYKVRAKIGNKLIGSGSFKVEEFVPERLKVEIIPEKKAFIKSDTVDLVLSGDYLFGAPAGKANYEAEYSYKPFIYYPEKYNGYSVGKYFFDEPRDTFI